MYVGEPKRITATAQVTTVDKAVQVTSIMLTPGSAAATLTLRNGGASGTVLFTVTAVANGASVSVPLNAAAQFNSGVYAAITGAGAEATIVVV